MFGKPAPNSSHLTKGLVKYVPNRGHFRAVPSQNGEKMLHPRPPQSLNWSLLRFRLVYGQPSIFDRSAPLRLFRHGVAYMPHAPLGFFFQFPDNLRL